MECTKYKSQKYRKGALKLNAIQADRHFPQRDHDFNTDARFSIIEKLQNTKLSKESITGLLKKRENFWIKEIETFHPKALNHEVN